MILKLVTINRPRSPAFPFVSSIVSSLSTVSSPVRNCILLHRETILELLCNFACSMRRASRVGSMRAGKKEELITSFLFFSKYFSIITSEKRRI